MPSTELKLDFLGIGAQKAGTTWVARMLEAHPDICLSEPKELHFFNEKRSYVWGPVNENFGRSFDWYGKHFAHCRKGSVKGEFTPHYLYDRTAPLKIKEVFPGIRLIVCLRNPIDRAYSQYNHLHHFIKREPRDFETVIKEEPEYVGRGLYYEQLQKYLQYFLWENILVILFGEIQSDPREVVRRLYEFLGVDSTFVPDTIHERINYSKRSRFTFVQSIIGALTEWLVMSRLAFLLTFLRKIRLNRLVLTLYTQKMTYPPMSEEARRRLREAFTEDLEKLERLLGRDLSDWQ